MKVYLLQHAYDYGENAEHTEVKIIGIYESKELAKAAVEKCINLPGFCDYDAECFYIDEYELNKAHWQEGFIKL